MAGLGIVWRMAVFAALGAVAMGIVLPCVAVVRHTTAHDWYAARKLTQTELMTWVGFDELEPIEYRTRDGRVVSVSRYMLRIGEAWFARERILSTIGDHAVMGAWAGFGVVVLFLILFAWLDRGWPGRGRTATVERAVATRPSAARRRPGLVDGVAPYDGGVPEAGLLIVPVTRIEEVAAALGRADLPKLLTASGPVVDAASGNRVLPPAPAGSGAGVAGGSGARTVHTTRETPAAGAADSDDSDPNAGAPAPAPRRKRPRRFGRWV